jgi:hypothetical protein
MRLELKKSVVYGGRRRRFVEEGEEIFREIKTDDATVKSHRIESLENSVQSWHRLVVT